jgi:hypothetical protein
MKDGGEMQHCFALDCIEANEATAGNGTCIRSGLFVAEMYSVLCKTGRHGALFKLRCRLILLARFLPRSGICGCGSP